MRQRVIPQRLLTVKEAAEYLGISCHTLYCKVGRSAKRPFPVRVKCIGRLVRFDLHDLDRYLASL
jgi:predicted DNA-binding transcriptional regulator AlpA